MSDTPTNDELTIHYSAMQDSVDLINSVIAGEVDMDEPIEALKSNIAHLSHMKDKFDFGERDMSSIDAAIAIDPETVTITPYVHQSDAQSAIRVRTIDARDFLNRFTDDEKLAATELAQSNAQVQLWINESLAGEVWLDHPKVEKGLSALVGAGKLTAERKEEIMSSSSPS